MTEIPAYASELIARYQRLKLGSTNSTDKTVIANSIFQTQKIEGDVIELGCGTGRTATYTAQLLSLLNSSKQYYCYDTFEGFPDIVTDYDRYGVDGKPVQNLHKLKKGHLKNPFAKFRDNFIKYASGCPFPIVVKKAFSDLTPEDLPQKISFAFFDGDLYQSIIDSFKVTTPKLSVGGLIYVHDNRAERVLSWCGVRKACDEMISSLNCFEVIDLNPFPVYKKIREIEKST